MKPDGVEMKPLRLRLGKTSFQQDLRVSEGFSAGNPLRSWGEARRGKFSLQRRIVGFNGGLELRENVYKPGLRTTSNALTEKNPAQQCQRANKEKRSLSVRIDFQLRPTGSVDSTHEFPQGGSPFVQETITLGEGLNPAS